MHIIEYLLQSDAGSLLVGLCIGICLIVSVVGFGLYMVFRQKIYLNFAIGILSLYAVTAIVSADPRDPLTTLANYYLVQFFVIVYGYCWLRLADSMPPSGTWFHRSRRWMNAAFAVFFVSRIFSFLDPNRFLMETSSLLSIPLFITIVIVVLLSRPRLWGGQLLKLGGALITLIQLPYVCLRAGLFTRLLDPIARVIPFYIVVGTAIGSIACLLGLIAVAREVRVQDQIKRYSNRAKKYVELRDQMNTPLQTLECAYELLKEEPAPTTQEALSPIKNALDRLRGLNDTLNLYERQIVSHPMK